MKGKVHRALAGVDGYFWRLVENGPPDGKTHSGLLLQCVVYQKMQGHSDASAAALHALFYGMSGRFGHSALRLALPEPFPTQPPETPLDFLPCGLAVDCGETAVIQLTGEFFFRNFETYARKVRDAKKVSILLDSCGGCMRFAMELAVALRGKRVEVIISGNAFSAAAVLAQCGTVRKITSDSKMMLHPTTTSAVGTPADLRRLADELDRREADEVFPLFHRCHRPELKEWLTSGPDYYFSAEQAVEFGLADEIIPAPERPTTPEPETTTTTADGGADLEFIGRELLIRLRGLMKNETRFKAVLAEAGK